MARLSIRIDEELKKEAIKIYEEMGMDISTAIRIYLMQTVRERKMPFQPSAENPINIQAREEALSVNLKRYADVDELMTDLLDD